MDYTKDLTMIPTMPSDYFDRRPTPGRKYEAPLTYFNPSSPIDREDLTMTAYPTPAATTSNVERIVHTTEYYTTDAVVSRYRGDRFNNFPNARAVQFVSGPLKGYVALRVDTTNEDWFLVSDRLRKIIEDSPRIYRAFNPVYGSVLLPSSIHFEEWEHRVLNIPDDVEPVLSGGMGTSNSGWSNRALTHPGFDVGGGMTYAEQWAKAPYTVCDNTTLNGFVRRVDSKEE